jgi:hypothetical protein
MGKRLNAIGNGIMYAVLAAGGMIVLTFLLILLAIGACDLAARADFNQEMAILRDFQRECAAEIVAIYDEMLAYAPENAQIRTHADGESLIYGSAGPEYWPGETYARMEAVVGRYEALAVGHGAQASAYSFSFTTAENAPDVWILGVRRDTFVFTSYAFFDLDYSQEPLLDTRYVPLDDLPGWYYETVRVK